MSEEAKIAYLREKINEARRKETEVAVVFSLSALLLIAPSLYFFVFENPVSFFREFLFGVGFLILVTGIVSAYPYEKQKNRLMEQLREMAGS